LLHLDMPLDVPSSLILSDVSRGTTQRLQAFATALIDENRHQNLISKSSEASIWTRHIEDSIQLLRFAPNRRGVWLDLGSGAGLPGLVIAICRSEPIVLVEARARRAAFLQRECARLELDHAEVIAQRLELINAFPAAVISARAFAPLAKLLTLGVRFATPSTLWILPKGKSASEELESVGSSWHGDFRIEPSVTDPQCGIIIATDVRRKA